jgi:hypothetical protein
LADTIRGGQLAEFEHSVSDNGTKPSYGFAYRSFTRTSSLSKTHIRATLLSKWIRTAEACRSRGDEASWRAILEGLTCRAVARLEKSWRRLDDNLESTVRNWIDSSKSQAKVRAHAS